MSIRVLGKRLAAGACVAVLMSACGGGGGSGNDRDSGPQQTTLRVEATDADGDALSYQWRVTGGTVQNRNARETVWTMPDGPGLHFAYVMVSDGKGGYAEQQYAVSTDALDTHAPARSPVDYAAQAASAPASSAASAVALRLRLRASGDLFFRSGAVTGIRDVYLPDVPVEVTIAGAGGQTFYATTDLSGEVNLPQAARGDALAVQCSANQGAPLTAACLTLPVGSAPASSSRVLERQVAASAGNNIRLHGHVQLRDGGVCGTENEFFNVVDAATVQIWQGGAALAPPRRVNRFGDYYVEAAGLAGSPVELLLRCGSTETRVTVAAPSSGGFVGGPSLLVDPHEVPNSRPTIARVVANGPDGNVRGRMVVPEPGAPSNALPGARSFLAYKGVDNALSACMYYRSFGAVRGCDAQGRMQGAISFDDWKRAMHFAPYTDGNTEVTATYINRRDLNLVRRMVGTRHGNVIAFYVCNSPGPEGGSQAEIDETIRIGLADERRVACVAMEWSTSPGVNGGSAFTKFLTFGPDGALIPSVNLDGRGEKYMPGACVACHGGSDLGARFPDRGNPSPVLGARFLPFDTKNYAFASSGRGGLSQDAAFKDLNKLVVGTEGAGADTPITRLFDGWYPLDAQTSQSEWVPTAWQSFSPAFYSRVVARSCRTCHVALGSGFDWDSSPGRFGTDSLGVPFMQPHACGGTRNLAVNASMPNALASLDRLLAEDDDPAELASLMQSYLGCSSSDADRGDPVHPRR